MFAEIKMEKKKKNRKFSPKLCRKIWTKEVHLEMVIPEMILGVWISTKPLLMSVSLKSWHTPDCRRKMAWLVVVYEGRHSKHDIETVYLGVSNTDMSTPLIMQCWIIYLSLCTAKVLQVFLQKFWRKHDARSQKTCFFLCYNKISQAT